MGITIATLRARHRILRGIRAFFWARGFLEVETPVLLPHSSQEPYLEPLRTTLHDERGQPHDGFLRMSPEFSLKKLVAAGMGRVFEIGPVFRDREPWGGHHNPEFTMLEWYRAHADYRQLMRDCEALVTALIPRRQWRAYRYQGQRMDLTPPWERLTMREAWGMYAQLDLDDLLTSGKTPEVDAGGKTSGVEEARRAGRTPDVEEPASGVKERSRAAMATACRAKGYTVKRGDTFDDLFFKIHLTEVEPKLGRTKPTFLTDWPAPMAALARRKPRNPRYAERVELYLGGLELANGFSELTDADEQRARFRADQRLRRRLGKQVYPIDPDFIAALRRMPPTAGIALGVDRLVMFLTNSPSIEDIRLFPAAKLFL